MKRTVLRIIIIAIVALALFIPQSVAFARVEDSDNGCPPRSTQGDLHASTNALEITGPINPPAPGQAWSWGTTDKEGNVIGFNPGNK